jgi:hypothetical protein
VKRASRNTIHNHYTPDSSLTVGGPTDPRFYMYNKNVIKNDLEKRKIRRAQSNIRPRQRFSTITAFHKNDIQAVTNFQQEEGITPKSSK